MAAAMKVMTDCVVECAICMEGLKKPKLLHCAHSFCLECLDQMILPGDVRIICPTCRYDTPVPAQGISQLRDDFRTAQLREIAAKLSCCEHCPKVDFIAYCMQCQKKLCASCLKKHSGTRAFTMHTVLKREALEECLGHGDYLGYVCTDCRRLVCASCLMTDCDTHECTEIGEAVRAIVKEGVSSRVNDAYTRRISELDVRYTQAQEDIETKANNIIKIIEEKKRSLLLDLTNSHDEVIHTILTEKQHSFRSVSDLDDMDIGDHKTGYSCDLIELLATLSSLHTDYSEEDSREMLGSLDLSFGELGLGPDITEKDGGILEGYGAKQSDLSQDQHTCCVRTRSAGARDPSEVEERQSGITCRRLVFDSRASNSSLIAFFSPKRSFLTGVIVRMDYPFGCEDSPIQILEDDDVDRGFDYQESVLDSLPDVKNDLEYAWEIASMRQRVRKYWDVETTEPRWEFDKIVEYVNEDIIIGKYGDFMVTCIVDCSGVEVNTIIESDDELAFRSYERKIAAWSSAYDAVSEYALLKMKRNLESYAIARYYSVPYLQR